MSIRREHFPQGAAGAAGGQAGSASSTLTVLFLNLVAVRTGTGRPDDLVVDPSHS
jgi:hypothetical protein